MDVMLSAGEQTAWTLLTLVVGWAIGLFSGSITESLKERRRRGLIATALALQIMHVREMALQAVYALRVGPGVFDREQLQWLANQLSATPTQSALTAATAADLNRRLQLSESDFAEWRTERAANTLGQTAHRIIAPILDLTHDLPLLDPFVQAKVLELFSSISVSTIWVKTTTTYRRELAPLTTMQSLFFRRCATRQSHSHKQW